MARKRGKRDVKYPESQNTQEALDESDTDSVKSVGLLTGEIPKPPKLKLTVPKAVVKVVKASKESKQRKKKDKKPKDTQIISDSEFVISLNAIEDGSQCFISDNPSEDGGECVISGSEDSQRVPVSGVSGVFQPVPVICVRDLMTPTKGKAQPKTPNKRKSSPAKSPAHTPGK